MKLSLQVGLSLTCHRYKYNLFRAYFDIRFAYMFSGQTLMCLCTLVVDPGRSFELFLNMALGLLKFDSKFSQDSDS